MSVDEEGNGLRRARTVVLINPNTSPATTAMMAAVVREELGGFAVRAVTAVRGPGMIVSADELRAAAEEVVAAALRTGIEGVAAFVVGAFGDPGVEELRAVLSGAEAGPRSVRPGAEPVPASVPVVGIGEAALLEAADTAFGVVTTTPELVEATAARVEALGLTDRCTGIRCTEGDPHELAGCRTSSGSASPPPSSCVRGGTGRAKWSSVAAR